MQESLYDRFRPFKPYDLVLALALLVLVAPSNSLELSPFQRTLTLLGGLAVFCLLDAVQRLVRVPTPLWQSLPMVAASTSAVALLIYLHGAYQYCLPFAMLNTTFATVAFGQMFGIATAAVSVAVLSHVSALPGASATVPVVWMLYLVVLLALVAILTRVNRLQQDALFDVVTGLRNHRYFQVRLREELQRGERSGEPVALMVFDLDNFKQINDQFGHARGDQVLRRVADALLRNARGTDVVCRYGGEELAVVLPGASLAEAVQVAERLRRRSRRRAPTARRPSPPAPACRSTRTTPSRPTASSRPPTGPCTAPRRPARTASPPPGTASPSKSPHRDRLELSPASGAASARR